MRMHLEVGLDLTYEIGTISAGNMKKIKQDYKTKNPKKGSDQKQLTDLPLDPYEIPGVVTLGATLQLKMGASITVSASGFVSQTVFRDESVANMLPDLSWNRLVLG